MQLIARISVRRHEMADSAEHVSPPRPGRSVAIFRIVGQSAEKATRAVNQEISAHDDTLVALAIDSKTMSDGQHAVYERVLAECHRLAAPVLTCGGDPGQLCAPPLAGFAAAPWFPSVASMVRELGEGDLRTDGKRPSARN